MVEQALLAGQHPLLVNSRLQDPTLKIQYPEGKWLAVDGGMAAIEVTDDVIYLAVSVRNVGSGLAVLRGWHVQAGLVTERSHPPIEDFTTQNLDIYVAPGDNGLWLSALRDPAAEIFTAVAGAFKAGESLVIDLLYGDFDGGQRVITQITLRHATERWLAQATRHFNVDRPDPR